MGDKTLLWRRYMVEDVEEDEDDGGSGNVGRDKIKEMESS